MVNERWIGIQTSLEESSFQFPKSSKLRNSQNSSSKQFLGPKYSYFIKKITDNNLLLFFFPKMLCWNSITGNLKHYSPGQFPIIMLEMELNFRFPIPSPKRELNVTEQNVTQWDQMLKYVTVSRCFPNNYHTAKAAQKVRYSTSHKSKGTHITIQHVVFASWYSGEHRHAEQNTKHDYFWKYSFKEIIP